MKVAMLDNGGDWSRPPKRCLATLEGGIHQNDPARSSIVDSCTTPYLGRNLK